MANTKELEGAGDPGDKEYPSRKVVLPAVAAIWLSFFLVALVIHFTSYLPSSNFDQDRTIIGTAIPTISKDFDSFGDIAWYESGFLLPLSILQLSFGLVYKYYSTKVVLLILVGIFEIGSIVCAAAPASNAFIVGRVISGIGGAGISAGSFLLIAALVPLKSRPKYIGALGSVFGISSAVGPILGGYLTSVTWRWCFWINVPIGALSLVLLLISIPKTPPPSQRAETGFGALKKLDPLGFVLIAPAVISLLFALEWGGTKYAWSNGRIIALLVISGALGSAFIVSQARRKEKATVPPRILLNRSVFASCFAFLGTGSALVIITFYLPIWFQVIQGKSPQSSGLSLLPLLLSIVIAVIGGGIATSVIGYYTPLMIIGSGILIVGTALITLWEPNTQAGPWIGYQVVISLISCLSTADMNTDYCWDWTRTWTSTAKHCDTDCLAR